MVLIDKKCAGAYMRIYTHTAMLLDDAETKMSHGNNVGALITRIGFWGVPNYDYLV